MNDDYIEYLDATPVEANWFRLELPWPKPDPWFSPRGLSKIQVLTYTKSLMAKLDFRINVDFKIASDYYSKNVVLLIHPSKQQYASWIKLQWK